VRVFTAAAEARLDFSPGISYFWTQFYNALLAPGSQFSVFSLFCAFSVGLAVLAARRYRKGRRIRLRPLLRAMFPKQLLTSRSNVADVGYFYFNIFAFGVIFGWAIFSYDALARGITHGLTSLFGAMPPAPFPGFVSRAIVTVMIFVAYELGYWVNHYLSHRIPFLWEFHKVHHSATVLTPLTNFRVHPIYMCIFLNILAVSIGAATGVGNYLLGQPMPQYVLSGSNVILVFFIYLYAHLQHSQLWISFTGWLGHLFMSPAHHQIHHSRNPAHFNKNLGGCLALWDWIFGTLYVPGAERERLEFGVEPDREHAHTIRGELIAPFIRAAQMLKWPSGGQSRPAPLAPSERREAF
jgi:sterol desaturase/sphingolipid hydroxylase (fatty acid hydroxylase superfamily)